MYLHAMRRFFVVKIYTALKCMQISLNISFWFFIHSILHFSPLYFHFFPTQHAALKFINLCCNNITINT